MTSNVFVRTCYSCTWLNTHCEAMVQLACTIIGLISLDTYLGECAAVLVLQCCLATCTPDTLWRTTAYVMTYRGWQPYCGHLIHHVCVSLAQPPTLMHQQLCAVLFLNGQTGLHPDCVRSTCCSQLHLLQLLFPFVFASAAASFSAAAPRVCLLVITLSKYKYKGRTLLRNVM